MRRTCSKGLRQRATDQQLGVVHYHDITLPAADRLRQCVRTAVATEHGQHAARCLEGPQKGSCRIFRLGYPDADYVTLARSARELWAELEDECGQRLLHPVPQLTFGPGLEAVRGALEQAGAPGELLPAEEAAARFPQLAARGPALLEPGSAVIDVEAALAALAAAVPGLRAGAAVTSITDDGSSVSLRTAEVTVEAGAAVVCAGPWTSGLLSGLGISVPSAATMEQVGYLAPATAPVPDMPIFIGHGGDQPYGLPVPGSPLYKIGLHHSGPRADPSRQDQGPDAGLSARLTALARRYLPGFTPELVRTERCVYDNSPDEDFIVDRVGRIVIGCGTSGHGFRFGPLLGGWLAGLAAGPGELGTGPGPGPAGRFSLSRFSAADSGPR